MRPLVLGDLIAAAIAVLRVPYSERGAAVKGLIGRARFADQWRRTHKRAHPQWGNGSLFGAAMSGDGGDDGPDLSDPDFLLALAEVCLCLAAALDRD